MADGFRSLTLPAQMESLAPFTEFVQAAAREAALPEEQAGRLELILEEALVNVFRYAYPEGEDGAAEVGYAVTPEGLSVRIRDTGCPYNPLEAEAPDLELPLEQRPVGGLGIFLIRSLADSVSYERSGASNILSFQLNY